MTAPARTSARLLVMLPVAVALVALLAACASKESSTTDALPLSEPARQGQTVAQRSGCVNCHSANGKPNVGPTWKDIWGSTVTFTDGRSTIVDEAYIRRSIQEPGADVLPGFASAMPRFSLSDDEIAAVTAYIRELAPAVPATR
jgi:cytochrome c oxidase subunit 2